MNLIKSNSRGRLAEVLGHELRNPLASAVASICVSLEMSDASDPRSTFLTRALDDLTRVSTLLTTYLDFGRSGMMNCEETDLIEVANRIRDRYRGHPAEVKVTTGEGPVQLRGEPLVSGRGKQRSRSGAVSRRGGVPRRRYIAGAIRDRGGVPDIAVGSCIQLELSGS